MADLQQRQSDLNANDELAARAAWLHYAGGMTQSAIAKQFGIPVTRAHRLIARAAQDGLIRIFVDADVAGCISLEQTLSERFQLSRCRVVPDLGENGPLPLRALGLAGADYLHQVLMSQAGKAKTIGIGHGRTLSALVDMLPSTAAGDTRFVSLLGGLTRKFAANPYDVIHRLAEKTGAEAYMLPVPLFANSADDKRIMFAQAGLAEITKMIDEATLCLLSVGAVDAAGSVALTQVSDSDRALRELRARGAKAEVLGQFLDADGAPVRTAYDGRVMAPSLSSLRGREVTAVAGGEGKTGALRAALRSGLFTGLITNEATARCL